MGTVFAFSSGLLFGLGLLASGMTDPSKVKGFLDVAGAWDPSLALVMGGAIAVALPAFALALRRTHAWSGERMELPKAAPVDARLLAGGVVFGLGWGLGGYCPGPGLVSAAQGAAPGLVFVAAMLAGMALHDALWPDPGAAVLRRDGVLQ